MMRRLALWLLVAAPGTASIFVCGNYLFSDWAARPLNRWRAAPPVGRSGHR